MKKRFLLILLAMTLVASVALSGCATSGAPAASTPAASSTNAQTGTGTSAPAESTSAAPATDKVIELTYAHMFPATHPVHLRMEAWAKAVSEATGGQISIKFYYAETMLKATETYDGVLKGVANMGTMVPAYSPGLFPMLELFDLPVNYNNCQVMGKVLWDCYTQFKPEELSKVKVLSAYAIGPGGIITKKSVASLADLKGKQIRCVGLSAECLKALGASPVSITMPEAYEALSKGVCDGVLNAWEPFITWKLVEVADYITMTPFLYSSCFFVIMNLDTWNKLPADIQTAMDKVSVEFNDYHESKEAENQLIAIQKIIDSGKTINVLSAEEQAKWMEALKPAVSKAIEDRSSKGPAQDFYNKMVELAQKYNPSYPSMAESYSKMVKK